MQYIAILLYAFFSVLGVIFFKLGSVKGFSIDLSDSFFSLEISWFSVLGLVLYVFSFLIYIWLIAKHNLGFLIPVTTGVIYILTLIMSMIVFKEKMCVMQIIGSTLILLGVILINFNIS